MARRKIEARPAPTRHKAGLAAKSRPFPVVGIGASAGSLEAFTELTEALPADTGMAFVFIPHLEPAQERLLVPLLRGKWALPLTQVRDGVSVEPNHVYVSPPRARVDIYKGKLKLMERGAAAGPSMPIDHFFLSLAACCKERAIGVVLSGAGTDGTFGLEAIKAEGGICFAGTGMPASAMTSGCIDFALPPRDIALELVRIARHELSGLPSASSAGLGDADRVIASDRHAEVIVDGDTRSARPGLSKADAVSKAKLQRQLVTMKQHLQAVIEELRATQEELRALTEQQASGNVELAQLNDDFRNLLEGVQTPILMVGRDRCIRRCTASAQKIFNIMPGDLGRPIHTLKLNPDFRDLEPLISRAFESLAPQEQEMQDQNGRYYRMSVRPYRTSDDRIDGLLISLTNIETIKPSTKDARSARDYANAIVETVREPLVMLDSDFRVVTANRSFYASFHASPQEIEKQSLFDLALGGWDHPELRKLLKEVLPDKKRIENFTLVHEFPKIGPRKFLLNARRLEAAGDMGGMILLAMEDITEQNAQFRIDRQRLSHLTASLMAAQEEERRHVSRELHDNLNQRLALIEMGIEKLKREQPQWPREIVEHLDQLKAYTAEVSETILNMSRQLHPSILEHLGLGVALESVCHDFERVNDLEVRFAEIAIPKSLPQQVSLNLYRVTQEALQNVAKHSHASKVFVSLVRAEGNIHLTIKDNGKGFDPERIKSGLGLISMTERAQIMGGTISIDSRPGAGTLVELVVPLSDRSIEDSV